MHPLRRRCRELRQVEIGEVSQMQTSRRQRLLANRRLRIVGVQLLQTDL